jgi:membrane protease YdiL (CAAX protease family)
MLEMFALAFILIVILPVVGPWERRLLWSDQRTHRKLLAYGITMIVAWSLTLVAVSLFGWRALLEYRSAISDWLPITSITGPVLGIFVTLYMFAALSPLLRGAASAQFRSAYTRTFRRHARSWPALLPNTLSERAGFLFVSITAGICEEILYRGFLIQYFTHLAMSLPVIVALVVASLSFGLGHTYQGWKGVLGTTIGGLAFGFLFLLTGSLLPGIILHILVDAQIVWLLDFQMNEERLPTNSEAT